MLGPLELPHRYTASRPPRPQPRRPPARPDRRVVQTASSTAPFVCVCVCGDGDAGDAARSPLHSCTRHHRSDDSVRPLCVQSRPAARTIRQPCAAPGAPSTGQCRLPTDATLPHALRPGEHRSTQLRPRSVRRAGRAADIGQRRPLPGRPTVPPPPPPPRRLPAGRSDERLRWCLSDLSPVPPSARRVLSLRRLRLEVLVTVAETWRLLTLTLIIGLQHTGG